jgi:hypothetical protein
VLTAGSPLALEVDGAAPDAASVLVAGLSSLGAPFKGGVMWPHPDLVLAGLALDANGFLELAGAWPAGLPSGLQLYLQFWIPDALGPHGWSATNGLRATTP